MTVTSAGAVTGVTDLTATGTTTIGTDIRPDANDGAALGVSGTAWSDAFFASGAILNFNAGNYTMTHSAGLMTMSGAVTVTSGNLTLTSGNAAITGTTTVTSASATALTVGRQGATNPAFQVNASTASSATGVHVSAAAAAGGVYISAISSGTDEMLALDAKGAGQVQIGVISTGTIILGDATTVTQGGTVSTGTFSGNNVGGNLVATQAQQETGTAVDVVVTPGRQHYHPSAAKVVCKFNTAGTIALNVNVTSITDNGTGFWTVNIANDFSSVNYVALATPGSSSGSDALSTMIQVQAVGSYSIVVRNGEFSGDVQDPNNEANVFTAAFGDL
jgi:hypothetical protein